MLQILLRSGADPDHPLDGPVCPRDSGEIEGAPCVALEFALHSPEIVRALLDAGATSNHHIFSLASRANLPADLLQRLDPTRLPDGTVKTPDALMSRAIACAKAGDMKGCRAALDDLNRSFALPKAVLSAHYFLRSLCSDNNLEDAEKALRFDPSQARNHRQYVAALMQRHRYGEALRALPKALKLAPEDARLYLYRAACRMRMGKLREAERDVEHAASIRELPQVWLQRGELALLQQRPDLAAQHFQSALDKGQKYKVQATWLYLAAIHEYAGKTEESLRCARQAKTFNAPGKISSANRYEEAVGSEIMTPYGLVSPFFENFIYYRTRILSEREKNWTDTVRDTTVNTRKNVIQMIESGMKENATLPQVKASLAYLLTFCLEDTDKRLRQSATAVRLCPKDYVYRFRHGELLLQKKEYASALASFRQAMELGQKNKGVENLISQARIAIIQEDRETASQLVEQADALAASETERRLTAAAMAALLAGADWPESGGGRSLPTASASANPAPAEADKKPAPGTAEMPVRSQQAATPAAASDHTVPAIELLPDGLGASDAQKQGTAKEESISVELLPLE